jgi:hypothetical protein
MRACVQGQVGQHARKLEDVQQAIAAATAEQQRSVTLQEICQKKQEDSARQLQSAQGRPRALNGPARPMSERPCPRYHSSPPTPPRQPAHTAMSP